MIDNLILFISTAGAFGGFGLVLDQFVKKSDRHKISNYIFVTNNVRTERLEVLLIRSLLVPFLKDGRVRYFSVLFYSIVLSVVTIGIAAFFLLYAKFAYPGQAPIEIDFDGDYFGLVLRTFFAILGLGVCTSVFDYASFWISKKLFIDRNPKFPKSILFIVIDVCLSLGGILALLAIVLVILMPGVSVSSDTIEFYLVTYPVIAVYVGVVSAILLSLIQIATLIVGSFVRLLVVSTNISVFLSERSSIKEFPFGYLFAILGVMISVAKLIVG